MADILFLLHQRKEFGAALEDFNKDLEKQKAHINRGINRFMVGITAHNIAVILVLAGRDDKAFPLFEEAVNLKRNAFGPEHPEVAVREMKEMLRRLALSLVRLSLLL